MDYQTMELYSGRLIMQWVHGVVIREWVVVTANKSGKKDAEYVVETLHTHSNGAEFESDEYCIDFKDCRSMAQAEVFLLEMESKLDEKERVVR